MGETAEHVNETAENRKKRTRSPNYPMFPLRDALSKIRLIFEHEKRNLTPYEVTLGHLGYKKDSGTGGRAISALRQFGLLEERSGQYVVTDLAFSLLYGEEGSQENEECLKKAALNPVIFVELVRNYPSGLPSDASLRSYLITKRGFNPDSVEEFIRIFKETIGLAKIIPGDYDVPSVEGEEMATLDETPRASTSSSGPQVVIYNYGLSHPRKVRAEVKLIGQEFKKEDVELLIEYLDLLKKSFAEKGQN